MSPDLLDIRLSEISERIRHGRERAGLTLFQLGDRSGVAPSTIQKIESRQMTPSIAVLLRIAAGLQIEAGDLIAAQNPPRLDLVIQRAGEHPIVEGTDFRSDKLSADIANSTIECWRIILQPGRQTKLERPQPMREQIIICETGTLELDFGDRTFSLTQGDTIHIQRKYLYATRNPGRRTCSYLLTGLFALNME